MVDGEMQADTAVDETILRRDVSVQRAEGAGERADLPELERGQHRLQVAASSRRGDGDRPILVGMRRPVHVLEQGADVQDIVNMAAVAVVDAQERSRRPRRVRAVRSSVEPLAAILANSNHRMARRPRCRPTTR